MVVATMMAPPLDVVEVSHTIFVPISKVIAQSFHPLSLVTLF
jgi:hypothetical protein